MKKTKRLSLEASSLNVSLRKYLSMFLFLIRIVFFRSQEVNEVVASGSISLQPRGINVPVKGLATGDGFEVDYRFTFQAGSAGILIFQFIDFVSQIVSVNGRCTIDSSLSEEYSQLEKVVVICYDTQHYYYQNLNHSNLLL